MDLILTSYVKDVTNPVAVQCTELPEHLRYCPEVKDHHRKTKKSKEAANAQKGTKKAHTKGKESKKHGKRKADLRPSASDLCRWGSQAFDPYQTTSQRDFIYRPGSVPDQLRTGSSNGYTFPFQLHEPIGGTTYTNNYPWKTSSSQQPMRRAASPRHKDDTIQKCKCLLLWKLLTEDPEAYQRVKTCFMKSLSSEDMQKVVACQFDTIYRQDYLGVQQESLKCPPCLPNIHRPGESPAFTDKQRRSRKQTQKPGIAACTTRYGSNKHWDIAAKE
ncbi:uncharacterized protein LOC119977715 [Scyliorhinus canicula]|uniref:uncharacterized protein LOC119977715 n=1 Tax=Scyliorhinus canicula TaxID=7830 RepID=UPI0018F44759|nr:uncharacterized protein LOC119977715 [Scyliorhinus canicula]XP_038674828.1 uncharacterized protein LOC119977715 [Scyliorhinus canicula]